MNERVARQLSKLSSTGRVDVGAVGRATGNLALTPAEVAIGISYANLDRVELLFVGVVYCGYWEHERELYERLDLIAREYVRGRGWVYGGNDTLWWMLCQLAITEATKPATCAVCHGVKEMATGITARPIPCEACGATGRKIATNADRAKRLDLTVDNFNRRYRARYESLYRYLIGIQVSAEEKIKQVL
jgi:hypothetical protein